MIQRTVHVRTILQRCLERLMALVTEALSQQWPLFQWSSMAAIRRAVSVKCWTSSGSRGRPRMLRSR